MISGVRSRPTVHVPAQISRLQGLLLALGVVVAIALGHSLHVANKQSAAIAGYRSSLDGDGDKVVSKSEVAHWFAENLGGGSASQADALKRFGGLVSQFDHNKDGSFDDQELQSIFDAFDEFPMASDQTRAVGADGAEGFQAAFALIGMVFVGLMAALFYEVWTTE